MALHVFLSRPSAASHSANLDAGRLQQNIPNSAFGTIPERASGATAHGNSMATCITLPEQQASAAEVLRNRVPEQSWPRAECFVVWIMAVNAQPEANVDLRMRVRR